MKTSLTVQDAIALLNSALAADPKAISLLFNGPNARVPCNDTRGSLLVPVTFDDNGLLKIGPLGIINGLFQDDEQDWGPIAMVVEEDGTVSKFIEAKDCTPVEESP